LVKFAHHFHKEQFLGDGGDVCASLTDMHMGIRCDALDMAIYFSVVSPKTKTEQVSPLAV
jgi:hypothetical protein